MIIRNRVTIYNHRITWYDVWHRIEVDEYVLNLTPTQYRICRAFFSASVENGVSTGELIILAYRSCDELQKDTDLSRVLLIKHISNLNTRITVIGLKLSSFQSGYVLTFSSSSVRKMQQYE